MLLLYLVHYTKALGKSFVQNKDLLLNHRVTKQMKNFSYYQAAMTFYNYLQFFKIVPLSTNDIFFPLESKGVSHLPQCQTNTIYLQLLTPNIFEIILLQPMMWRLNKPFISSFTHTTYIICHMTYLNNIHKQSYKSTHKKLEQVTPNIFGVKLYLEYNYLVHA